jgi:hypothetical protein
MWPVSSSIPATKLLRSAASKFPNFAAGLLARSILLTASRHSSGSSISWPVSGSLGRSMPVPQRAGNAPASAATIRSAISLFSAFWSGITPVLRRRVVGTSRGRLRSSTMQTRPSGLSMTLLASGVVPARQPAGRQRRGQDQRGRQRPAPPLPDLVRQVQRRVDVAVLAVPPLQRGLAAAP